MSKVIEAAEERGTIVQLELALEGAHALIESLKLENKNLRATLKLRNKDCNNLRAANEAKHREIAEMDRRHVDAVYELQCLIRELEGERDE